VGLTNSSASVLSINNSSQVSVGGILAVNNEGRVNINGGSTSVGGLSIPGTGVVNMNASMTINFGSPVNDPISTIVGYLTSGYSNGSWTGIGIDSTNAAASVGHAPLFSVGYADGNTDVGTPAEPNQILIMYTLAGDANLDGTVNFTDLLIVAQNYNKTGEDWAGGNFTYDPTGLVGFADLLIVAQNFNQSLPLALSQQVEPTAVKVPEPGALALTTAAAAGLLARRRRRKAR
jgi:hypothetical protein